jgi:hypothetical protein
LEPSDAGEEPRQRAAEGSDEKPDSVVEWG